MLAPALQMGIGRANPLKILRKPARRQHHAAPGHDPRLAGQPRAGHTAILDNQ